MSEQSRFPVKTGRVRDRRSVHYSSIGEMYRDVAILAAAEQSGRLVSKGNWTLGQALGHIAAWASYALDGYPPQIRPPWIIRFIVGFRRRRMLAGFMPAGIKIPGIEGGTLATERIPTEEGIDLIHNAFDRLERQAPAIPNPLFGRLTHREWINLNLGHAALHLSFFTEV